MITEFVQRFDAARDALRDMVIQELGKSDVPHLQYETLMTWLVETINPKQDYDLPDPTRITRLDYGDYQGTLVFVVAAVGYQPSQVWATTVSYGSCSYCDALESAVSSVGYGDDERDEASVTKAADQVMTLMLHMLQRMKEIS